MTKKELIKDITSIYTKQFVDRLKEIMFDSNASSLPKEAANQYLKELEKMIIDIKNLCEQQLDKEFTYNELKMIKGWFSKDVSQKWDKFVVSFSKEVNSGQEGAKIYKEFSDAVVPILTKELYKMGVIENNDSNVFLSILKGFEI